MKRYPAPLIRGRLARLFDPASTILSRHDYPDSVSELCAETMALAACLSTTLKFDGVFTVQAKGDGAVKTLFADVTSDGHIRSYAAFDDQKAEQLSHHGLLCCRVSWGQAMSLLQLIRLRKRGCRSSLSGDC